MNANEKTDATLTAPVGDLVLLEEEERQERGKTRASAWAKNT